jgi:acetyl esterase/lipase
MFGFFIRNVIRRRQWGNERALVRRARRLFGAPTAYGWLVARGLKRELVNTRDVKGEWLIPKEAQPGVILYIHGGGFVSCSSATHRPITAALARLTHCRVFSVDYRLAPESRLPAAHEDVVAAYEWLVSNGARPSHIALAGDSAGGNLVFGAAVRLRDKNQQRPACLVAFSPWTDLVGRGTSGHTNDGRCAMFRPENLRDFASAALGQRPADDPAVSPAYAALHDLPSVLLHVGGTELLLDDATYIHQRVRASGGSSDLVVYEDVPHCWQMLAPLVPEATHSLRAAAAFIVQHLPSRTPLTGGVA